MSSSRDIDGISEASSSIRVLVIAQGDEVARWNELQTDSTEVTVLDNASFAARELMGATYEAVVLTKRVIDSQGATSLVESIRALSRAAVILEGNFSTGERLPSNADGYIPPDMVETMLDWAIDAGLRRSDTRLASAAERGFVQSLLNSSQTLVLSIDSETRVREFNRACEIVTGKSFGDVFGTPLRELLVDRNDKGLSQTLLQNSGHIFPTSLELEFESVSNGPRVIECSFSPFFDEIGNIRLAVVTGIDVTEQRHFAAALRESEEAFRCLVEASPDAIVVASLETEQWLYANPAALKLLQVDSIDALDPTKMLDIVDDADQERTLRRIEAVRSSGEPRKGSEVRLRLPNGEIRWVETLEIPLRYRGREAVLAISRDLTERKEFTARMMQLDRMVAVGTLAAGVGHEINNPLAYLTSNIEYATHEIRQLTESDGTDINEVVLALEEAQEGAHRVRDIVADLKDLSRGEKDTLESLDIEAVIESALNVAWHEIRNRAHVTRNFDSVPLVHGSGSRVRQLFVNVLVNAAQAIPEGDPDHNAIHLSISNHGPGRVKVVVHDEGTGIPERDQKRVFDPFFTTKPVGSGTGLGLTISQRIMEAIGGSISLTSTEGEGTVVTMVFDAIDPEFSEANEDSKHDRIPIRLLLIDDEPMIANSVRRALPEASEVVSLENGAEAIAYLEQDRDFDAVLCDLVMPNISGSEFHAAVAERWPDLEPRIVFMTGGAYTDSAAEFAEEHSGRILDKPFASWDLREALYAASKA